MKKGISAAGLGVLGFLASASIALAQTTTPTVPDTGGGGEAAINLLVLGVSAVAAVVAGTFLARTSGA